MVKSDQKRAKTAFLFFSLAIFFLIFIGTLFYWVIETRKLPSTRKTITNSALRGDIISANNFTIAKSKKLYKAMVDTRNIDPDKKELFLKLYSIYSGTDVKKIQKRINDYFGIVTLSYKIDALSAQRLKELAKKLYRLRVFISYQNKNGTTFKHGLDIVESGEYRVYNYNDILTPIIGHVRKYEKKHITKIYGVNGLEKQYENTLKPIKDAYIQGYKDSNGYIILDGNSRADAKIDGLNIHLNISLKLQKIMENILDNYKTKFQAKELVACVMQSKTGKILALASSNRYNPSSIKKTQYQNLNISAIKFTYEPGSVLKPIIFALLLKEKKVNPYDIVKLENGRYKIGKNTITDDHKYKYLSAQNVIVHSSNIGISKLSQKLNYIDYHSGLKEFGFSKKSGIDLPYEHKGTIPNIYKLKSKIYKAVTAYGYGLEANFIQLLKAYNVFNNSGKDVTPTIVNYYQDNNNQKYFIKQLTNEQVIPQYVAKQMQKILIKTVEEGTGQATIIKGLSIGGKTGTAKIASKGRYIKLYNSSFFGFANDKKSNYTIGVLVREPNKQHYYASASAVPVFKSIVEVLVQESFLTPTSQ
jgi:cell division protein FtsI (penicillin-binding protein 3)